MREYVEFRIPEAHAAACLPPGTGENVGYGIRKVLVDTSAPLFDEIGRLHRHFRSKGRYFFSGREYRRRYTRGELTTADVLYVWPKHFFEPCGEECGTMYDEGTACAVCGGGARQVGPLFLRAGTIPKNVDFAQTIAGEVVVTRRVRDVFFERRLLGASFEPVRLTTVDRAVSTEHFQLEVVGQPLELGVATRAGEDPFDLDGTGRCERGDLVGLNLLSEVHLEGTVAAGADVMTTRQMIGVRRGLLRPRPLLLLSRRAWLAIEDAKLRGLGVEVAHLSSSRT